MSDNVTVVGAAGFLGQTLVRRGLAQGHSIVAVDRRPGVWTTFPGVTPVVADLLTDQVELPGDGPVFLVAGSSDPRPTRPWLVVLDNALTTARLVGQLGDREVVLVSSIQAYGRAPGPLTAETEPQLPGSTSDLLAWCDEAVGAARSGAAPWRLAEVCRRLADHDPSGRWVYGLAKRAQELMVTSVVPEAQLTVVRAANLFGAGQDRVVARLVRRAQAGLPISVTDNRRTFVAVEELADAVLRPSRHPVLLAGTGDLHLRDLAELVLDELGLDAEVEVVPPPADDSCGVVDTAAFAAHLGGLPAGHLEAGLRAFVRGLRDDPLEPLDPPVQVVVPPRPERPDVVGDQIQAALWSGVLKHGGPRTQNLTLALRERLQLGEEHALFLTSSGTAALRMAVVATAGIAQPGAVAVLPSFAFMATGEALVQLGYDLRWADVDPVTWTLDPVSLEQALAPGDVSVVVAVDALGAPANHAALRAVCLRYGVPLVADSAPALGASIGGRAVGTQADAHAFSMSFAKVVSTGGAGGAVVVRRDHAERLREPVDWTRSSLMGEIAAAVGHDLVSALDDLVERRRQVAEIYDELPLIARGVTPQQAAPGDQHARVHWVARFSDVDRDLLQMELGALGVLTKPYYAPALHTHDWRGAAQPAAPMPVTALLDQEALALPMSSEMSAGTAELILWRVVAALERVGSTVKVGEPRPAAACRGRQAPRTGPAAVPATPSPRNPPRADA
jgi:dTDP-4-amino-4,6-dideoxygalactose transaminase/nucleoside-diphosphate-sugar epimerase